MILTLLLQLPQCVHGMKFDHISAIYHLLEEQVAEATQAPSSTPAIPLYPQTLPVMLAHPRKSSITTGESQPPARALQWWMLGH